MATSMMNDERELRKKVYEQLCKVKNADDVYDLFSVLGYPTGILHEKSSRHMKDSFNFRRNDEQKIKEVYSILSFGTDLPVFLLETTTLSPQFIRSRCRKLLQDNIVQEKKNLKR